jgi:hypothetical protein
MSSTNKVKKYLIIAETDAVGYFVEIHENIETAKTREQLFFELAFNPPTDHKRMREEFKPLGNYPIHDSSNLFFKPLAGSSNGFYSTYIIEIDDTFSFEQFSAQRNG